MAPGSASVEAGSPRRIRPVADVSPEKTATAISRVIGTLQKLNTVPAPCVPPNTVVP